MGTGAKGPRSKPKPKKAACLAFTAAVVVLIIVLAALYFAIYRPKDPKLQVPSMQLLSLYPAGYPQSSIPTSVNLSLNLQVSMYNPNRATFHVEDGSTACLFYYGTQVGFAPLPTGAIPAQSASTISVGLSVQGPSPLQGPYLIGDSMAGILQISTSVTVLGKVTTLNIFSHHSEVISKCNVNVSLSARGIVAYTCPRSYSLDT